ncbi:MAG: ABC transporter substrate-binding protein, partial [Firmicutes bacterium]|nr:ABC transporter substrate-binding protein [Bacillota bacterium]
LSNTEHASELCETYGIVAKSAVALKAIPDCNLCCVVGDDIQTVIEPYYNVLYNANPSSIGGAIPDEGFYFAEK